MTNDRFSSLDDCFMTTTVLSRLHRSFDWLFRSMSIVESVFVNDFPAEDFHLDSFDCGLEFSSTLGSRL